MTFYNHFQLCSRSFTYFWKLISGSDNHLGILSSKRIFITGGTGTIGVTLVKYLSEKYPKTKITVYSRDEHKQFILARKYPAINCVLGDVRDKDRLEEAIAGHDVVIHLAALKQVPRGESDGSEFTKTNILGTENLLRVSSKVGIEKVVFMSSDKAVLPSSHYGATKLSGERLTAEFAQRNPQTQYSIIRLGNVWKSRGSVSDLISNHSKELFSVTNPDNTRFSIAPAEGVEIILLALMYGRKAEIFIPKMKSFKLHDLLIAADIQETTVVGLREGERMHEILITDKELEKTFQHRDDFFIIVNQEDPNLRSKYISDFHLKPVSNGNIFHSEFAPKLEVTELQTLLNKSDVSADGIHKE
ncbi:polysaccharide biosynthesis protein [Marinoscillum sp.]|uniref:polysaccharide biosynthesis protein n=1 Tax=Marinoscillum sp. TaxID=2024838 RepID=UPI003BAC357E